MGRQKQKVQKSDFVLFDVHYEDGTRTSNRKVPAVKLVGLDGDGPARAFVEMQDRCWHATWTHKDNPAVSKILKLTG
jgi:hypothetical protein